MKKMTTYNDDCGCGKRIKRGKTNKRQKIKKKILKIKKKRGFLK